jgi:fructosamine-3-kinase
VTDARLLAAVSECLSKDLGVGCERAPRRPVHGGCINDCYQWQCADGPIFVKVAERAALPMLEAEADGLRALLAAHAIRVPVVRALGSVDTAAFLALEWIEPGKSSATTEAAFGRQLAAQHQVRGPRFGWHRDNTIGSTPQSNAWCADWPEFFRDRRLRPQLQLAIRNGFAALLERCGERLLDSVSQLLAGHVAEPVLLHGDLWGGNWFSDGGGAPVIFDPAVYYGDRETDLAMTQLFGGFGHSFHEAYASAAPLAPGADTRRELYNLYHILNHANLFGGAYASRAREMIERLLAQRA